MDHSRYLVSDPNDPRFRVTALIEEEELVIDIRTELESGERSAALNAADQLRRILARFFPRYKSIRTSWRFGENLWPSIDPRRQGRLQRKPPYEPLWSSARLGRLSASSDSISGRFYRPATRKSS